MSTDTEFSLYKWLFIGLLIVAVLGTINYYSQHETVNGFITAKWAESHTSCDDNGNCSTSIDYLFQIKENGRIYRTLWGTSQWDRLQVGQWVQFTAYGYNTYVFGYRAVIQTATDFETTSYLTSNTE